MPETTHMTLRAAEAAAVWAETTVTNLLTDMAPDVEPPEYGSPEWARRPAGDRLRSAAVIAAAEAWRREVLERRRLDALAEADPKAWFREVTAEADRFASRMCRALAATPTDAELVQRRRRSPAVQPVTATPGWSPVAIPGRPGWWRHNVEGRQVDLPHRHAPAAERRHAA